MYLVLVAGGVFANIYTRMDIDGQGYFQVALAIRDGNAA